MARVQKITVTCDGPCGQEFTEPEDVTTYRISARGETRQVDLCTECETPVLALYSQGASVRSPGRPRRAAVVPTVPTTSVPVVSPVTEVVEIPVGEGATHIDPSSPEYGTYEPRPSVPGYDAFTAQPGGFTINAHTNTVNGAANIESFAPDDDPNL
jgi:hypothetical protein